MKLQLDLEQNTYPNGWAQSVAASLHTPMMITWTVVASLAATLSIIFSLLTNTQVSSFVASTDLFKWSGTFKTFISYAILETLMERAWSITAKINYIDHLSFVTQFSVVLTHCMCCNQKVWGMSIKIKSWLQKLLVSIISFEVVPLGLYTAIPVFPMISLIPGCSEV